MEYFRYVLLVIESEDRKFELLSNIPKWEYCDKLGTLHASGYCFKLINKTENIQIFFKKINDCLYTSMNVNPYDTKGLTEICEPQEQDIHNDILFKLCMEIKKKYVNLEVRCGIIPCESDEF